MSWIIKRLLQKAAEKGLKINPADVLTQQNADDIISILKELLL